MIENLKRVQRTSLSDGVLDQITDLIARRILNPGDQIPSERQLCQQLGVGRTSVREALRSLSVAGILESHAGDGTFVSLNRDRQLHRAFQWGLLLDPKRVEDLVETRLMLECHTSYLAATKSTSGDLEVLQEAIRGMEMNISDPTQYLQHDMQFHLGIARASQNSILENLLTTIRGYLHAWITETLSGAAAKSSIPRALLSVNQHSKILRALKRRNAEEARRAMKEHVISSSRDLRTRLKAKPHS